ncbi:MAG: hypothetical protein II306_00510 [Clostridia bacterium]|nr:hypothetical protein [Clostridia bacterium]
MKDGFLVLKCNATKDNFKRNSLLITFTAVLVLGLLAGVFSIKLCGDDNYYGIASLFKNFISTRSGQPYYIHLFWTLASVFSIILLCYVLGLGIQGQFIVPIVPFCRGFGIGLISGYLYCVHSLYGIGLFALVLLPEFLSSTVVILLCCCKSFKLSRSYFSLFFSENIDKSYMSLFKSYNIHFLIYSILSLLFSLITSAMSFAFLGMFEI